MDDSTNNNGAVTRKDLDDAIGSAVDRITELVRDVETHLLTEFHRYAKGVSHRLHSVEVADDDLRGRLHLIEERVLELERRIRP
jgi:hypothetical protein